MLLISYFKAPKHRFTCVYCLCQPNKKGMWFPLGLRPYFFHNFSLLSGRSPIRLLSRSSSSGIASTANFATLERRTSKWLCASKIKSGWCLELMSYISIGTQKKTYTSHGILWKPISLSNTFPDVKRYCISFFSNPLIMVRPVHPVVATEAERRSVGITTVFWALKFFWMAWRILFATASGSFCLLADLLWRHNLPVALWAWCGCLSKTTPIASNDWCYQIILPLGACWMMTSASFPSKGLDSELSASFCIRLRLSLQRACLLLIGIAALLPVFSLMKWRIIKNYTQDIGHVPFSRRTSCWGLGYCPYAMLLLWVLSC